MLSVFSEHQGWSKCRCKLGGKSPGRTAALELHFKVEDKIDAACYDRNQCNIFFISKLFIWGWLCLGGSRGKKSNIKSQIIFLSLKKQQLHRGCQHDSHLKERLKNGEKPKKYHSINSE